MRKWAVLTFEAAMTADLVRFRYVTQGRVRDW